MNGIARYQPKVVLCRMKTATTVELLKERYAGQALDKKDLEAICRGNAIIDGLTLLLSLWDYDNQEHYHLSGWKDEDDEKMMRAMYEFEQAHPFPGYLDDFERFAADWKAGEWDPGCSFCFGLDEAEVVEVAAEEKKVPQYSPDVVHSPPVLRVVAGKDVPPS